MEEIHAVRRVARRAACSELLAFVALRLAQGDEHRALALALQKGEARARLAAAALAVPARPPAPGRPAWEWRVDWARVQQSDS